MADSLQNSNRENEYDSILQFAKEYNRIPYSRLDAYTLQAVNLFALPENNYFQALDGFLEEIISALPALKRIFSKPITRLKDTTQILPVESVHVINNRSVAHLSQHTELWGNITEEGLKPKKLMTLTHEEDYKIYENVAFVRLVDALLSFTRKNIQILKDVIYSCQPMHFNLLERTNHLMYFLAIGKLHVGYVRVQDKYQTSHERCLAKLLFVEKTLREKLHSPVYRFCKKDHSKIVLKKTNIFRLQKDYRQVYVLLKRFASKDVLKDVPVADEIPTEGYDTYCTLMSLFAIGHFNFEFSEKAKLNFFKLSTSCQFADWTLSLDHVSKKNVSGLRLRFTKNAEYTICLLFHRAEGYSKEQLQAFQADVPADEYLQLTPFEAKDGELHLSLFDIDSFRRIQQCLLRGMIYADADRSVCPFCGKATQTLANGCECPTCKTQILSARCPETDEEYLYTQIKDFRTRQKDYAREKVWQDKEEESKLFYRNIHPLVNGLPRCPKCGKAHFTTN
ncbi:MAG: DUF2357 domain-containing protein [Clostridia bacterium]|nr:DUF2357 domain-containing protein [Clostridia bacterium]